MKRLLITLYAVALTVNAQAQTTTYDGTDSSWNNDDWNNPANWSSGVPSGTVDAVIGASETPSVKGSGATPSYTGSLTMGAGSTLHLNNAVDAPALGTGVIMSAGCRLILVGDNFTVPVPITLLGNAELKLSESSGGHHTKKTFTQPIYGAYQLTLFTGNNNTYDFRTNNFFDGITLNAGNSRMDAYAAGSMGAGDVTINDSAALRIYAADSIADTATLYVNGAMDTKLNPNEKLRVDANETVAGLYLDGFPQPASTYGATGSGATNELSWMSGAAILTVTGAPADTNAPTVTFAGPSQLYVTEPTTYTVTFSEPHTPELSTSDLENAGTAGITILSLTPIAEPLTGPLSYQVVLKANSVGSLQLQIKSGAAIADLFGNSLVTPVPDDDTITVDPLPFVGGELGVWQPWANNRTNPATGLEWAEGDQYRLAFVSSGTTDATSTNITDYNTFVSNAAAASTEYPLLGNTEWKVIGSTAAVDARDNTETNPGEDGTGVAIFLTDGYTKLADSNNDLWDNNIDNALILDENGAVNSAYPFTGTDANGTATTDGDPGDRVLGGSGEATPKVQTGESFDPGSHWMRQYNANASDSRSIYAMSGLLTVQDTSPKGLVLRIR